MRTSWRQLLWSNKGKGQAGSFRMRSTCRIQSSHPSAINSLLLLHLPSSLHLKSWNAPAPEHPLAQQPSQGCCIPPLVMQLPNPLEHNRNAITSSSATPPQMTTRLRRFSTLLDKIATDALEPCNATGIGIQLPVTEPTLADAAGFPSAATAWLAKTITAWPPRLQRQNTFWKHNLYCIGRLRSSIGPGRRPRPTRLECRSSRQVPPMQRLNIAGTRPTRAATCASLPPHFAVRDPRKQLENQTCLLDHMSRCGHVVPSPAASGPFRQKPLLRDLYSFQPVPFWHLNRKDDVIQDGVYEACAGNAELPLLVGFATPGSRSHYPIHHRQPFANVRGAINAFRLANLC